MKSVHRGEVYFVRRFETVGRAQQPGRPAIIVSNEANNLYSPVVEVVYLTSREKKPLPTHAKVFATGEENTALCEQVTALDYGRIIENMGRVDGETLARITEAVQVQVGVFNKYN